MLVPHRFVWRKTKPILPAEDFVLNVMRRKTLAILTQPLLKVGIMSADQVKGLNAVSGIFLSPAEG